jgi:fatty-acyl-CoA synthase
MQQTARSISHHALTMRALARHPQRIAFRWDGGQLGYAATTAMIAGFQKVFDDAGLAPGQCLALLTANRAETWCAGVAAQGLGLMITWLHPLGSLESQRFQLEDSEAVALIVDADHFGERGGELAVSMPGLRVFRLGSADYGADLLAAAAAAGAQTPVDRSAPDLIATLNYTGGTTGRSKGVARSSLGLTRMAIDILADFEIPNAPRYLAIAPISHVTGTNVLPVLLRGGTVHLLPRFDPERILETVAAERINFMLMVPTMIYGLLDHPALGRHDLGSLELLLYGASAMAPTRLLEGIERIGPVFSQLYGQTECYPIAVMPRADHDPTHPERFSACGFPTSGVEVRLLDDAGQPVASGEPGEICVRGPVVMQEYWRQPEQTAAAFADGWLHTGDIARADEVGRLYIVDRKKDMIVSGGFNVYPREIEDTLASHPAVGMATVVGVPDEKWGETVLALVIPREGAAPSAEELIAHVRERKGSLLAPKRIEFVDALPLTPLGKVDKKAIRAGYWAGRERGVG